MKIAIATGIDLSLLLSRIRGGSHTELTAGDFGWIDGSDTIVAGDTIRMTVTIDRRLVDGMALMVNINGDRDVTKLEPVSPGAIEIYTQDIKVRSSRDFPYTSPEDNSMMLVQVTRKGEVIVQTMTVVGQLGNFFYCTQGNRNTIAVRYADGKIKCPTLVDRAGKHFAWPQLNDLVVQYLTSLGSGVSLMRAEDFVEEPEPDHTTLKSDQVLVTSVSVRRGKGTGIDHQGRGVNLHWSKIVLPENGHVKLAALFMGETVQVHRFNPPPKGSKLRFDAGDIYRTEVGELPDSANPDYKPVLKI